jgi:hypothetical protein
MNASYKIVNVNGEALRGRSPEPRRREHRLGTNRCLHRTHVFGVKDACFTPPPRYAVHAQPTPFTRRRCLCILCLIDILALIAYPPRSCG